MSKLLIQKIAVKLACDRHCIFKPDDLPLYWRKTPSNLAYRLRVLTGWNIRGRRDRNTGRIHFERFPAPKLIKQN